MAIGRVGVVAIGDEVLQGEVVNTNAAWIARSVGTMGLLVASQEVVGDRIDAIVTAVERSLDHADLVVLCGGLGPTHDDCTSAAVSQLTGAGLVVDEGVRAGIEDRYGGRPGADAAILKQSTIVAGAMVLHNSRGTAPGQIIALGQKWLLLLPGPPRELQAIFEQEVTPWLEEHRAPGSGYQRDTLTAYEFGESQLFQRVEALAWGAHPVIGIYAGPGRVEFRMQGPQDVPQGSLNTLRAMAWVKSLVPAKLYPAVDSRSRRMIEALTDRGLLLGLIESVSGGLLASTLIAVDGASSCIPGGVIAYRDDVKIRMGVDPTIIERYGAVSAQCAKAMAGAARRMFSADIGMATTGFAGPSGGTSDNPVGTFFVAVDDGVTVDVRRRHLSSERTVIRQAVVELGLTALWEVLDLG